MKLAGAVFALLLIAPSACKKKSAGDAAVGLAAERVRAAGDASAQMGAERATPERVVLTGVSIKTVDPQRPVDLLPEELAKQVGRDLIESGQFARSVQDVPAGYVAREARLDVVITYDVARGDSPPAIVCAVEAKLVWLDGGGGLTIEENVIIERPLSASERKSLHPGMVATQVASALQVVAAGIAAKESLRSAGAEEVVSAVSAEDPELVAWALAIVGDRRLVEAVDSVVGALDSSAAEVRDAAISALVALGDARGIQPLAQLAEFSDHDQMRTVIEAISAIGGRDAIEYLEFVASGHPDDEIKQRAQEGLERIRKNPRAAAR